MGFGETGDVTTPSVVLVTTTPMDVDDSAKEDVETSTKILNAGILNGYEDGTFRPEATLTNAEAAAVLDRLYTLKTSDELDMSAGLALDSQGKWFTKSVENMVARGILSLDEDGNFNPQGKCSITVFRDALAKAGFNAVWFDGDELVTRAQVAVDVESLLSAEALTAVNKENNFSDVSNVLDSFNAIVKLSK